MKVQVDYSANNTHYIYPSPWVDGADAWKYKALDWMDTPTKGSTDFGENGNTYRYVYVVVPNDVADAMDAHPDVDCEVCDRSEWETFDATHYPAKPQIKDEAKVMTILAKAALGEQLTDEEKDALNPDKEALGINYPISRLERILELEKDHGKLP